MRTLALLAVLASVPAARAAEPPRVTPARLPDWFPSSLFKLAKPGGGFEAHDYDEASFILARKPKERTKTLRGRYWKAEFEPLPAERAKGGADGFAKYRAVAAEIAKAGFKEVWMDGGSRVLGTFERGGEHPAMLTLRIPKTLRGKDGTVEIVEEAPNPDSVTLVPPGPTPAPPDAKTGFPYLAALGPMRLEGVQHGDQVIAYCMGEKKESCEQRRGEWRLVYSDKDDRVSPLAFVEAYSDALAKAGWTLGAINRGGGSLIARYDKEGRDIRLYAHRRFPAIEVSDTALELESALASQCKAAVYGINFDFDQATLRPDAEPALNQVLRALKSRPGLKVEIGGHTDDVGEKAYNLDLSKRRAEAARAWLIAHGIGEGRLTSAGYGDSRPVVKNDTDEHRALNRRVELKKPGCP